MTNTGTNATNILWLEIKSYGSDAPLASGCLNVSIKSYTVWYTVKFKRTSYCLVLLSSQEIKKLAYTKLVNKEHLLTKLVTFLANLVIIDVLNLFIYHSDQDGNGLECWYVFGHSTLLLKMTRDIKFMFVHSDW